MSDGNEYSATDRTRHAKFIIVISICCSVAFLIVGIFIAFTARHYQISGQPMPNGKNGTMLPSDGYLIAAVLVLLSLASFLNARKFWRG
jgi:hypothetical protein